MVLRTNNVIGLKYSTHLVIACMMECELTQSVLCVVLRGGGHVERNRVGGVLVYRCVGHYGVQILRRTPSQRTSQ